MRSIVLLDQVNFLLCFVQCEWRGLHMGPLPPIGEGAGASVAYVMIDAQYCANCGINLRKVKELQAMKPHHLVRELAKHIASWQPRQV